MFGFVIFLVIFIMVLVDITCIVSSLDADKQMKNIDIKKRNDE